MLMCLCAVLVGCGGVSLHLFVVALVMLVGCFLMMMRRGRVVRGGLRVMLGRRMLGGCHKLIVPL